MEDLEYFLPGIMSDDSRLQLEATTSIKDIVSTDHFLLEKITLPDVVSRFVLFLSNDDFPDKLKREAAWLLASMTLYGNIQVLVDCDTVPLFVQLINADSEEVRSMAVWALGNIAAESTEHRDLVLSYGVLMTLLSLCDVRTPTLTTKKAPLTLTILCGGRPCPPLAQIQPALPILERFLQSKNSGLLLLSSSLLACLFEGSDNDETRQTLMGFIPRLMQLFQDESEEIQKEVLCTISSVLSWENRDHSQVLIDQNPIPSISSYLPKAEDTYTKTLTSYIVYNIACWDQNQLEQVFASGVVQNMIPLLQDDDPILKLWCIKTISTVTSERNHEHNEHIRLLVRQGCIGALCGTLTSPDQFIIPFALSALEDILGVGQEEENVVIPGRGGGSRYARMILDAGGLEKINALKASQDLNIKYKAINIVAEYFNED